MKKLLLLLFNDPEIVTDRWLHIGKTRNWFARTFYMLFLMMIDYTENAFEEEIYQMFLEKDSGLYHGSANY